MADSGVACATPIDIPLERSLYVGNMLSGILFGEISSLQIKGIVSYTRNSNAGLNIFAFFASVYCISDRTVTSDYRKGQTFYVVYGGILLALTAIVVATDALLGQYMWIDHRNYPGGPLGYFVASQSEDAWFNVLGLAAGAAGNILGDGLLVRLTFS
jgi:hypothetical protein